MATDMLHRPSGAALGSTTPKTGSPEAAEAATPRGRTEIHAFFDLDRTLLRTSSLMAAAAALRSSGLVDRRKFAAVFARNLVFAKRGCGGGTVERVVAEMLGAVVGRRQADLLAVEPEIRRRLTADMRSTIVATLARHRAEGHRCVIVSAGPIEVVEIAASIVDADAAFGTVAEVDGEGRYTGRLEHEVCYGAQKVRAVELAGVGVDWARSWAYSDAASDLPLLESVGHPVAVSPDRALRRIAGERAWRIHE